MPPRYEKMRDKFAQSMPLAEAKGKAARIFNATRASGEAPVTRGAEGAAPPKGRSMQSLMKKGGR